MYAFKAGARAIMAHYERMGIAAEKVEKGVDYGIYHTTFKIKGEPLVSIIIPNKDHSRDLDVCVRSILEKSTYGTWNLLLWKITVQSRRPLLIMRKWKKSIRRPCSHLERGL